ncbi:ChaN family lipoprotein [bacterium]|nr:ChaN family lipoprotein [bacterium]
MKNILLFILCVSLVPAQKVSLDQIQRDQNYTNGIHCELEELKAHFPASESFNVYEAEFLKTVGKLTPSNLSKNDFDLKLKNAKIIVMADNHVSYGSQSNTIRLIEDLSKNQQELSLVIEWIDRSYQSVVNQYLIDQLSLEELKEKVQFDQLWAFSWDSYKRVLEAAKVNKVAVYLVENLKDTKDLISRDQSIFDAVAKIKQKAENSKILVVYGTYHSLGKNHLLERFRALSKESVAIVSQAQNAYWAALKSNLDTDKMKYLSLSDDVIYLHDAVPFVQFEQERFYYLDLLGFEEDEYFCE